MDGGEERYFVVDGQHRLAAARLRGDLYDLPCVVTDYADRSEEAAAFVALNRRRRPLGALDFFKASIAEGEAEATAMLRVIEAADAFGAKYVRLGGQLVVLEDHKVVTVLPRKTWRGALDARRSPVARAPRPPRIQELLDD